MDDSQRVSYVPLALALLTAALLQAVLVARMPTVSADGIIFTNVARNLADNPREAMRQHDQHPGYPAAMLAATRVVQALGYRHEPESWMVGGIAVSFVCGLAAVGVVWLLTRDLYGVAVANLAAFIFAVLPIPRALAADAQSDMPHALLYLTAAWLAARGLSSGRIAPLLGAGLATGTAYLIRPEGLEVLLVALPLIAWRAMRGACPWRRAALGGLAMAGAAILIAAPYPLLAGKITSKQVPFAKGKSAPTYIAQQAEVHKPGPPTGEPLAKVEPAVSQPTPAPLPQRVAATPAVITPPPTAPAPPVPSPPKIEHRYTAGLVFKLAGKGLVALIVAICQGFKFVFIPLYLVGQWTMIRRQPDWTRIGFMWCLAGLHMAVLIGVFIMSGYIANRHVLPLVGLAMPFTALGMVYAAEVLGPLLRLRPRTLVFATLLACLAVVLPYCVRPYNREFLPVIAATEWIQEHAPADAGVVCNSPYVGYYGTRPTTILGPQAVSLDAALAQGQSGVRFDYVVLHVNAHDYRSEWLAQVESRYRQIADYPDPTGDPRGRRVLVFEATDAQARRQAGGPRS